jgi:hypothetical protein
MRIYKVFFPLVLLFVAVLVVQPVLGSTGTITVAYRGSGGSYIGDTVIFDGLNTLGNTTLIKITGPGLPPGGLPLSDLNGAPGSGNTAVVGPDGIWKFAWYTSSIRGVEKMQTARYTITVSSLFGGSGTSSTSIVMKKPVLSITASPNPASPGNYVQLTGIAEHSTDSAHIEVANPAGKVVHAFTSPVSASGYLNYGFHVDMPPGQYRITVSNPAMGAPYHTFLTVIPPPESAQVSPETSDPGVNTAFQPGIANNGSDTDAVPSAPAGKSTQAPASPITVIGGIVLAGAIMMVSSSRKKDG